MCLYSRNHRYLKSNKLYHILLFSILLTLLQAVLSVLLSSSLRLNFVLLRQVSYVGLKKWRKYQHWEATEMSGETLKGFSVRWELPEKYNKHTSQSQMLMFSLIHEVCDTDWHCRRNAAWPTPFQHLPHRVTWQIKHKPTPHKLILQTVACHP